MIQKRTMERSRKSRRSVPVREEQNWRRTDGRKRPKREIELEIERDERDEVEETDD